MSRSLAVVLVLSSLALCYLSFRLLSYELALVPGNKVVKQFNQKKPVEIDEITRLRASRERSLAWHQHGEAWGELGLALLLEDSRTDRDDSHRLAALSAIGESLRRQPVQPHGWVRYAIALRRIGATPQAVGAALLFSVRTGPYTVELLAPRLRMLLRHARHFSGETDGVVATQIKYAWRLDPQRVVEAALSADAVDAVANALADNDDDLAAFVGQLVKQR